MKFFLSLILIALLSFAACLYLPWWSIAAVSFVVILFLPQHPGKAFLSGFLSLFLLWGAMAFWLSYNNSHNLAEKMSMVILTSRNASLLILLTALTGAVTAGMAALCAGLIMYTKEIPKDNL